MKSVIRFTLGVLLFGLFACPAQAAFSSLYIFGDTVSDTTTGSGGAYYYGNRWSNGRIWVELLAQELNLTNNFWYSNSITDHLSYTNLSASSTGWSYSSNNLSYFDDNSANLVANVNAFTAPPDASNTLIIIWVSDADFSDDMANVYPSTDPTTWSNAISLTLTNHFIAITNLYAKGARTLIMPNTVDITEIPEYDKDSGRSFVRQMVMNFNTEFTAMLSNAMVSYPGLKIYEPDFFSLLDNILANPAAYGVTNALYNGQSIDVIEDFSLSDKSLNGPGTNYIFWDYEDPTAKVHAIMADLAKQLIAPAQIGQITSHNGTNQLNLANVPVGLDGIVLGGSNLALTNWTTVTNFSSTNSTLSVSVPISGPMQFYRLYFPFSWTWP